MRINLKLAWTTALLLLVAVAPAAIGSEEPPTAPPELSGSPSPAAADPTIPQPSPSLLPSGANLAVIRIEGVIYDYTLESLKRRVDEAVYEGASLIVIEIDTPGGLLHSAMKISRYIKTIPRPTVAWVNDEAFSAGSLISAACNQVLMSPSSIIGDCAPIIPGQNLAPTERAKALSPLLEEFRDSAAVNGYDYALFHAMCVLGVEVYKVRHTETGKVRLVNQADYRVMVDGASPNGGWLDKVMPKKPADQENMAVAAATITVAKEEDRGKWELVERVHDGQTLLTLNQQRAQQAGLCANDSATHPIRHPADLVTYFSAAGVKVHRPSQVASVAYWLTQPWVRALLVVVMLLGLYLELQAPGMGVPGGVALLAMAALLGAPYMVGLAQLWHVALFFVGVLLLLIEAFVIPGFGFAGVSGLIAMFVGLVLMVVPSTGTGLLPMPGSGMTYRVQESVLATMAGLIGTGVGFYYITKYFGQIPILNRLVLTDSGSGPMGSSATGDDPGPALRVSGDEATGSGWISVGAVGNSVTQLRPSGRVDFDGRIIDVVTPGEWIADGEAVHVVEVSGNRVVVEAGPAPVAELSDDTPG